MTISLRRLWKSVPVRLFVVFVVVYGLTAGASLGRHSLAPHFVYLAESFLHGRLDLLHVPEPPYDLTLFVGRWYVSFPPLPALLMLPLVAVHGLAVSDIAFSVVLGAVNVSLFYVVLSRLETGDQKLKTWLCVLMGLGTPLWYCAALGSVWYTAHVAAVTCLCLYALEATGRNRPLVMGFWLGAGFLARAPVLLVFPLGLVLGLGDHRDLKSRIRFLLLFALGAFPALLGQATYNWARFGNPLEFGYRWMNSPGVLLERQATWGQFSLYFLRENLYTLLIRPPIVSLSPFRIAPDPWGMGLLFTCPALLLALARTWRPAPTIGRRALLRLGLWLSILLVQIPSLLYFNTGSYQFGYRFALDWLPLGVMLAAMGTGGRLRWWDKALIVVGVLMHLWGVSWMYVNFNGQPWHLQYVELARRLLGLP
ncbi:MAG: hypothetical protein GY832_06485 [Chloroflexi bacterium]|nr:hypothetical protein [Chloroflexota bacterium]